MSAPRKSAKRWDDRNGPFMKQRYSVDTIIGFAAKKWRATADDIAARSITDIGKASDVLNIDPKVLHNMRTRGDGTVSSRDADRMAITLLGVHPSAVWHEWFDEPKEVGRGDQEEVFA